MIKRRYAMVLLLLIVGIFAISSVSASDLETNGTDGELAIEDMNTESVEASDSQDEEIANQDIESEVAGEVEPAETLSDDGTDEIISSSDDSSILANSTGDEPQRKTPKFTVKKTGIYYKNNKLTVTVTDKETGIRLKNVKVIFEFDSYKRVKYTNDKGIAVLDVPFIPDTYILFISIDNANYTHESYSGFYTIAEIPSKIVAPSLTLYYKNSGYLNIKALDIKNKPIKGAAVTVKLNGKTYKLKTTSVGTTKIRVSGLNAGKYSASISISLKNYKKRTSKAVVNVKPRPLAITAKNFETLGVMVTVKDKLTNKALNNIPLYLKIYSGSSFKTVKMTTATSKSDNIYGGIVYMNTGFSGGKHTVAISSANKNYYGSASTYFYIPDYLKYFTPIYIYFNGGKVYTNAV